MTPPKTTEPSEPYKFEDLRKRSAEWEQRPWWQKAPRRLYYWTRRQCSWSEWKYRGRRVIGFFIRGWRGWATHDTWGLDHYLSGVLAGSLRYLAYHHHGVPGDFVERHLRIPGDTDSLDIDAADYEWTQWLLDKAQHFDWYYRDEDGTSDELGWIRPDLSKEELSRRIHAHTEKMEKFYNVILPEFIRHFGSLWD